MQRQSSLGTPKEHRTPTYQMTKIGRVVSIADYKEYGKIEVVYLDYGSPMPVWVLGDIDREPSEGDLVMINYAEGRKDTPYLAGFVRNESFTSNMVVVTKDYIRFQLPADKDDLEAHMLDDAKLVDRPYLEINKEGVSINHPTGNLVVKLPNGVMDVTD